jgi:hypothetical protein
MRELWLVEALQALLSPLQAPPRVLQPEQSNGQEPLALQPPQAEQEPQPRARAPVAFAALPSRPLPSPSARLPPRFLHPPRPSDDS